MEALNSGDPQHIGGYWLAGRLGQGGQGVVYEAYDAEGRRVALKVLHAAGDDGSRDRFAKEAAAAERVASFCTARVLDADLEARRPYIVSEYVAGPSLRQAVVAGRVFAGDDLHRLATAVATALTAIHEAGVIHRDLKPDNVLLGPDGPRVIDFGIARTLDMSLTRTGEVAGTPSYLAPEVFTGQRAGTPADVFAWGATMVFAATGVDPFRADNLGGVMHRVLSQQPDLSALPPRLATLVAAALRKDPAARPQARDLLLALVSGGEDDTGGLLAAGSRTAQAVPGPDRADPALGTIAEDAYGALEPDERDLAAEVFLRLVEVGEDGQETGRRASHDELFGGRPEREAAAVRRILRAFSYVVASDVDSVELSRPALLRAWPRLRMWVDADRDGLAVLGQISRAARQWAEHGRRDGDLLQGSRLEQVLSWAATGRRHVTLTPRERDFLRAGTDLTRRRARRRRLTTTALAGLLVIALAAGGVAVWQREQAARQRDIATARQVAAEADRMRTTDPAKAMLLSVAAWRVAPLPETRSSLMAALQQPETAVFRDPPVQGVARRALSRDGRTLVSVSEGGVNVYDVRTGKRTGGWPGLGLKGELRENPVLSRSGRLLAQTTSRELGVWDLVSGRLLLRTPLPDGSDSGRHAVFGEHETTLVVALEDDLDHLIDVSTGRRFGRALYSAEGAAVLAQTPLVDPTGRHLLLAGERFDELSLPGWNAERRYPGCRAQPWAAAFSEDGATLACAGDEIVLLDAATGRPRSGPENYWSCDICSKVGTRLRFAAGHVAAFNGRDVRVWRVADRREVLSYRAEGELTNLALDPGGRTVRYLMDDTVVSVDLAPRVTSTPVAGRAQISPGARWAAVQGFQAPRVRLMDLPGRREVATFPVRPDDVTAMGFDPAATRLVIAQARGQVRLMDLRTLRQVWAVPVPKDNPPLEVTFSPDGRTVALSMGQPGQVGAFRVVVFDAVTGRTLRDLRTTANGGPFTRDGRALVTGSGRFLDVTTGQPVGRGFDASVPDSDGPALSSKGLMAVSLDVTGRIALWNVDGPTPVHPALPRAAGTVGVLAFSPDGGTLAGITENGMIQFWDPAAGQRLGGAFDVHTIQHADSLVFSADGGTLYAAVDNTLHEIPVDPDRVAAAVCRRAGAALSERDWALHLRDVPYQRVC